MPRPHGHCATMLLKDYESAKGLRVSASYHARHRFVQLPARRCAKLPRCVEVIVHLVSRSRSAVHVSTVTLTWHRWLGAAGRAGGVPSCASGARCKSVRSPSLIAAGTQAAQRALRVMKATVQWGINGVNGTSSCHHTRTSCATTTQEQQPENAPTRWQQASTCLLAAATAVTLATAMPPMAQAVSGACCVAGDASPDRRRWGPSTACRCNG
jgi:hypothetical protein